MTASTVKGIEITNIESSPITPLDRKVHGTPLRVSIAKIEAATTSIDEINDTILLCAIPSNAVIVGIFLKNDDLDSHACPLLAADVGLFYSGIGGNQKKNGKASGDVVLATAFGTAVTTLRAANVTWQELTNEAQNIDNYATEAWAAGGLSSDPGGILYVGLKVTAAAATAAAGGIVMRVDYR